MKLQIAQRKKSYLRLNLSAPSGAGKTMSALLMGYGLVGAWDKIAVIDTENGSASLYSHLGNFNTLDLAPPFTPERFKEAIKACLDAGMECIILDSASAEWSGPGGCLELNEKLAQAKYRGNTWSAWNETTPRHDSFVQTLLQAKAHVITCTRSKTETIMGEDKKVKKVGMKDIQRDGWEFELTVSLNIDRDSHTAIASKDRTNLFEGKDPFVITSKTGEIIKEWCESGAEPAPKEAIPDEIGDTEREKLLQLLDTSTMEEKQRTTSRGLIANYTTWAQYNKALTMLLANQKTPDTLSHKQINGAVAKAAEMDN